MISMIINVCSCQTSVSLQMICLDDVFCWNDGRKLNTSRKHRRTDLSGILACRNIPLTARHRISKNRICASVLSSSYANVICDSMNSMSSL